MSLKLDTVDDLKFEIEEELALDTKIKVVGVGGGGSNAVTRMINEGLGGVEFYVVNTDQQALQASPSPNKVSIGAKITKGLGVGSDPSLGRRAALEDTDRIIDVLEGAEMVFVTAGLGGGTGGGAAPVVAALAKEMGALTVAVVTKPFSFEGPQRLKMAEKSLADLASTVDTVISIPNDRLLELLPRGTSFVEAFRTADDVLRQGVQGISDIITTPGLINRDFSDVRAIMLGMGYAMMGTASATGENAAIEAARLAIGCPLLEEGGVRGARGVLINITANSHLGIHAVNEACTLIREATENDDVQINFGVVVNETMDDEVKVTVIATGFQRENLPAIERRPAADFIERPSHSLFDEAPGEQEAATQMPEPEPRIFDQMEEEPEEGPEPVSDAYMAAPMNGTPSYDEPPPAPRPQDDTEEEEPEQDPNDALDIPAIARRERGLLSFGRRTAD